VHQRLLARYDIGGWHWRVDTPALEICLGAILVQHTNWANVERALAKLREAKAISLETIDALSEAALAELVRPAGTPIPKARRLKAFADLARRAGGLEALLAKEPAELRLLLLATYGIGPETADAIRLYAAGKPVTVHDAYTARLFRRIGIGPERDGYDAWQAWLDAELPKDLSVRWANHAAVVLHCKETCLVRPRCDGCVLADICSFAGR
jgi:endonuclease-3 related protein